MNITIRDLAKMIDHSLLHPTMTYEILRSGCELAKKYDVASVCIKPYAVTMARDILKDSEVKVGTVIGFPHGNSATRIKIAEAILSCEEGAVEIDMVINIGKALGSDWDFVKQEIDSINQAVISHGAILKVIFENDFLDDKKIIKLCEICNECNVAFVKTSTGYGFVKQSNEFYSYKGATLEHLKLMRKYTKPSIEVKAAGGVRTLKDLLSVRALGVTRVGATATETILKEAKNLIDQGVSLESLIEKDIKLSGGY